MIPPRSEGKAGAGGVDHVLRSRSPKARRSTSPPRDQHESGFTRILSDLVARLPGARAAVLVDQEGETVDYAGMLDPYDAKIAAAHWRIVLDDMRATGALHRTAFIALRASRASYQAHVLPEGYALVIAFVRAAGFVAWQRAVAACVEELAEEAAWDVQGARAAARPDARHGGFALEVQGTRWFAVDVSSDARRRPLSLGSPSGSAPRDEKGRGEGAAAGVLQVEVLGSIASGIARRERGWRIRMPSGLEATLVREPGGHWYVDDREAARAVPRSYRENPVEFGSKARPRTSSNKKR